MNRTLFAPAALLAVLAACGDSATGPAAAAADGAAPLHAAVSGGIAGEYVVVLREGADPVSVAAVAGVHPRHVYTAALTGFAAALNPGQLAALRHHPAVAYVEQDQVVEAAQSVPWNLDRIDQPTLPLNGQYVVNTGASNVHAYIIDTGIRATHPEFGGRAQNVLDVFGGTGDDCHGHGTGVAGVVGSTTYGVAKLVELRGVRVLNCSGVGSTSGVIAGVDWVRNNAVHPAVANLSLSGGASNALNTAVTNLFLANVFVAVPSGNNNANACNYSPSGAFGATTVSPTNQSDVASSFANYGPCVHIFAPGVSIATVAPNSKAPVLLSGSSLASPHVAGVGALVFATYGGTSNSVRNWILSNASAGVVVNVPPNTPNRLVYTNGL
jgi:subtilisin family serine protease